MTEVRGNGYGSAHDWENKGTEQISSPKKRRNTLWVCRKCHEQFRHFYRITSDIFEAMKQRGVKEECVSES